MNEVQEQTKGDGNGPSPSSAIYRLTEEQRAEFKGLDAEVATLLSALGDADFQIVVCEQRRAELRQALGQAISKRRDRASAMAALCGIDLSKPENGSWQVRDGAFVRIG